MVAGPRRGAVGDVAFRRDERPGDPSRGADREELDGDPARGDQRRAVPAGDLRADDRRRRPDHRVGGDPGDRDVRGHPPPRAGPEDDLRAGRAEPAADAGYAGLGRTVHRGRARAPGAAPGPRRPYRGRVPEPEEEDPGELRLPPFRTSLASVVDRSGWTRYSRSATGTCRRSWPSR